MIIVQTLNTEYKLEPTAIKNVFLIKGSAKYCPEAVAAKVYGAVINGIMLFTPLEGPYENRAVRTSVVKDIRVDGM